MSEATPKHADRSISIDSYSYRSNRPLSTQRIIRTPLVSRSSMQQQITSYSKANVSKFNRFIWKLKNTRPGSPIQATPQIIHFSELYSPSSTFHRVFPSQACKIHLEPLQYISCIIYTRERFLPLDLIFSQSDINERFTCYVAFNYKPTFKVFDLKFSSLFFNISREYQHCITSDWSIRIMIVSEDKPIEITLKCEYKGTRPNIPILRRNKIHGDRDRFRQFLDLKLDIPVEILNKKVARSGRDYVRRNIKSVSVQEQADNSEEAISHSLSYSQKLSTTVLRKMAIFQEKKQQQFKAMISRANRSKCVYIF